MKKKNYFGGTITQPKGHMDPPPVTHTKKYKDPIKAHTQKGITVCTELEPNN